MSDYVKDLATEYGMEIRRLERDGDVTFYRDGKRVISLTKHALADERAIWMWGVQPLGRENPQSANGRAYSCDEALSDAEGMLRHYMTTLPPGKIERVWGVRVLKRINLQSLRYGKTGAGG
jgi:hypothetical protein